jgi:hypothetical protein
VHDSKAVLGFWERRLELNQGINAIGEYSPVGKNPDYHAVVTPFLSRKKKVLHLQKFRT